MKHAEDLSGEGQHYVFHWRCTGVKDVVRQTGPVGDTHGAKLAFRARGQWSMSMVNGQRSKDKDQRSGST